MKHLKQPVARRANLEDDCTGHFFEQRFYSGALLTGETLIAAMGTSTSTRCGRSWPVAGPDDGAPQAAARLRRAGAAAMACRPDHAVPGDAPARLRRGLARRTPNPSDSPPEPGERTLAVARQRTSVPFRRP